MSTAPSPMQIDLRLAGDLEGPAMSAELDAALSVLGDSKAVLLLDCQNMTSASGEARELLGHWAVHNRERVLRIAVVTGRRTWRTFVAARHAMGKHDMRAFQDIDEAREWLAGRKNRLDSLPARKDQPEAEIRGQHLAPLQDWIREELGPDDWKALLSLLGGDNRQALKKISGRRWYPAAVLDALLGNYVAIAHSASAPDRNRRLGEMGAMLERKSRGTIASAARRFAKPEKVVHKLAEPWERIFRQAEVVVREPGGLTADCVVYGLHKVRWVGSLALGWIYDAYADAGAEGIRVSEQNLAKGRPTGDPLHFEINWR